MSERKEGLYLRHGPVLERVSWEKGDGSEYGYVTYDVTDEVLYRLNEPVVLEEDLRLSDIFHLLANDTRLQAIYKRDWAEDFVHEAFIHEPKPYNPNYDPEGIEYLELRRYGELDTTKNELNYIFRPDFDGVGFVLQEDIYQDPEEKKYLMYKKGTRITWGIDFTPLRDLMDLPLRYNPEVVLQEGDSDKWKDMKTLEIARHNIPYITLNEVFHGILWELSFHGSPADKEEFAEELRDRKAEVDAAIEAGDFSGFKKFEVEEDSDE